MNSLWHPSQFHNSTSKKTKHEYRHEDRALQDMLVTEENTIFNWKHDKSKTPIIFDVCSCLNHFQFMAVCVDTCGFCHKRRPDNYCWYIRWQSQLPPTIKSPHNGYKAQANINDVIESLNYTHKG